MSEKKYLSLIRKYGCGSMFKMGMVVCVTLGILALTLMLALYVSRPTVLQAVLPLRMLYTSDHAITEKGMVFLGNVLDISAWTLLAAACFMFVYTLVGQYVSARLPWFTAAREESPLPVSKGERVLLIAIVGLGFLLRILQINRGLFYDELYTAYNFVNVDSFWKTISTYSVFNNHIAYSVSARFAQLCLGQAEWVLRLPALLCGIAMIVQVWVLGRRWLGVAVGLFASLLIAIFPLHVMYSESARGYTGMTLFVFLSSVFYLKLVADPKRSTAFYYIFVSVIAVYFHLYSLLVLGVQMFLFLALAVWQIRGAKTVLMSRLAFKMFWFAFISVVLLCAACYLPVAPYLVQSTQRRGQGCFQPLFPWQVLDDLSGNPGSLITMGFILVASIGIRSLWIRHRFLVIYCVCIFVLPIIIVMGLRPYDLYSRFFIYFLPWYALLLSQGACVVWNMVAARGLVVKQFVRLLMVLLAISISFSWISNVAWRFKTGKYRGFEDPYREVGKAMLLHLGSNVGLCAIGEGCEELSYYVGQKLITPRDLNELLKYITSFDEVRCVHNATEWDSAEHRKMALFLGANGKRQRFTVSDTYEGITLYTLFPKKTGFPCLVGSALKSNTIKSTVDELEAREDAKEIQHEKK